MGRIVDENYEPVYCDALEDESLYVGKKLDLVEVVRCKDCIHLHDHDCPIAWGKTDYDYCSFGERKDEVENG